MIVPVNQTRIARRDAAADGAHAKAFPDTRPATPAAGSKPAAGSPGSAKAAAGPVSSVSAGASSGSDETRNAALDVTADSIPDTAALADSITRRVQMLAAKAAKSGDVDLDAQLRIDRLHAEFDSSQAERAELMREANVLRDMAMEQQKRDDEILKKWISLI